MFHTRWYVSEEMNLKLISIETRKTDAFYEIMNVKF